MHNVRFRDRLWSHPGHVSYLIGATPLNWLRCTIARRRLTHCDYASRRCLSRARDFISGVSSFLLEFFSFLRFFLLVLFSLPFWFLHKIDLEFRNSIRGLEAFFVSCYREISRKAIESPIITKILNKIKTNVFFFFYRKIKIAYMFNFLKFSKLTRDVN